MSDPTACPECLRRSWLLGLLTPYIEKEVCAGADLSDLMGLDTEELTARVAPKVVEQILARASALSELHLHEQLQAAECWAICRHDGAYPRALRDSQDAPWALIGRGNSALLSELQWTETIGIIGSTRATSYGREVADQLGREAAQAGLTVVSGLSAGVQGNALRGAVDAGRAVAVHGCGVEIPFPAAQRPLWRRLCEFGAVVSELPPGTPPWRWTLAARSRIITALVAMSVVVEAQPESPTMEAVARATAISCPVGAVPGPIYTQASMGPNELIADGNAHVIRHGEDILRALPGGSGGPRSGILSRRP